MDSFNLSCTGRKVSDSSTDYADIKNFGLEYNFSECENTGTENKTQKAGSFINKKSINVCIKNSSEKDFLGVIHIKASIKKSSPLPKVFMPGFIYGHNTGEKPNYGRKDFPRIRKGSSQKPESTFWMTRSDRLAEPVSILYDTINETCTPGDSLSESSSATARVFGISGDPYLKNDDGKFLQFTGFTCNVCDKNESASTGITLGYEDAPWLFIQSMTVLDRAPLSEKNIFCLKAGKEINFKIFIYDYEADNETGIYKAIEDVYFSYHESPRKIDGMTVKKATELLSNSIKDYAWLKEEKMYTGFVYDFPGGNVTNKIGSLTWTNGMSVACPMLMAANRLDDDTMRNQAVTFIEEVVTHSLNKDSGLLYDAVTDGKWSVHGWWYDGMRNGGHSGYLNGQALYYILKSYLSEKSSGRIHENWLNFVKPVIEKLNSIKNTDGEYPFSMSEKTGAGLEYDSLGGAWCLCATSLYSQITGEQKYLSEMKKSEQHYYDAFVKKCECYGGPLDTDKAVDDEGILAYIRAVRILHEITGEKIYLEHLKDAIFYETTFKLGYNTPVQVKPLSDIGWSSSGGSITSTANPHIHPMSSTIIDEMIYFVKHADTLGNGEFTSYKKYIEERLSDTIGWGLQTFNTKEKEYGYGRIGWMSERFCFCQGLVVEKYADGTPAGTWFALMSWAASSIIEGFVGDAWE